MGVAVVPLVLLLEDNGRGGQSGRGLGGEGLEGLPGTSDVGFLCVGGGRVGGARVDVLFGLGTGETLGFGMGVTGVGVVIGEALSL